MRRAGGGAARGTTSAAAAVKRRLRSRNLLACNFCHLVSDTAGVGRRGRRSAAAAGAPVLHKVVLAYAGLGKHELDVIGRFEIARDRGGDGAGLLIARQQEEGRR